MTNLLSSYLVRALAQKVLPSFQKFPDIGIFFSSPPLESGRHVASSSGTKEDARKEFRSGFRGRKRQGREEEGLASTRRRRRSYLTFVSVHAESYSRRVSLGQLISMCRGGTY